MNISKRAFDLVIGITAVTLLSPFIAVLAVVARAMLGGPVIFAQMRPGKGGRLFRMYKFRTMSDARDSAGNLLPDEQRLNKVGQFLRSTSLDELPELINVIRGEMSLVGPRPLLLEYLPLYSPQQARRHEIKPGITGWAQVNGRNALSWEDKFALDVWYVDKQSFVLDLKILWLTVRKVFLREGIAAAGEATMPRFTGTAGRSR